MIELTAAALIASITVLFLSIFLGFELIAKVPPTLHTPLMSGANAISGITVVGALLAANAQLEGGNQTVAAILGVLALILAMINCVGGFMVTGRMLRMFKRKEN
ncbi:MAG: NAD(P) transhydrogenase subunit alpha [bacterium]|nr:NAD(P) transhydrogenase subunit alpha [bacterium]